MSRDPVTDSSPRRRVTRLALAFALTVGTAVVASGGGAASAQDDADAPLNRALSTVVTDRFADTRPTGSTVDGRFVAAGRIAANSQYEVQIAGRGDVPPFAVGAIVELTMVGPSGPGYATVHPCGPTRPEASAVNYTTGVDVANEIFADLSATGSLCVYTFAESHVLIDVVGYTLPDDSVKLMTPARLAESRLGAPTVDGLFQGFGRTSPGSTTTVRVTGRAGVPAGISAAILNVAAVDPTDNGYISVDPCLPGAPTASSLNYVPGVNRANELIAQVDALGDVCIFTQHGVDLIVDVVGYVEQGSSLISTSPVRFAETRAGAPTVDGQSQGGKLAANTSRTVQITGRAAVPAGAVAAIVNVAAVDPDAAGFFTVDGCNTPRPNASSLNYTTGVNGANELVVQLSATGTLCVFTSASTHTILDVVGYILPDGPVTMNVLHINDHHSNLEPTNNTLNLGTSGGAFSVPFGGFPRITAKVAELEAQLDNVVKIHAGDAITGTLYYTLFQGEADADMMNTVCFDLFALGNHEFDDGDATLVKFLDFLAADPDCDTATIAANVVPAIGTPLAPVNQDDYIQPYVVKQFNGIPVGFIGIDIADKTKGSSQPDPTTQFLDEVETTQRYVDELASFGIDNIVVVTHYGYQNDIALAGAVTGVDAIVGGDSHSLLGDFGTFGLPSQGAYPTVVQNADGDPVCIVQAWQYSWVVGELAVTFDDGKAASCDGTPHLLLGDTFTRGNPAVAVPEPERSDILAAIAAAPQLSVVTPDPAAAAILQTFTDQLAVLRDTVIGTSDDLLCTRRVPNLPTGSGDCALPDYVAPSGARLAVNGGFIQQIVSDAFLARSFQADLALQNGGGVRVTQEAGDVTIGDVYTILPFNNTLVNLTLSGAEVKQSVEDALNRYAANPGANTGAFPYGSGIRWSIDMTQPNNSRVTNVEVRDRTTGVWGPIDLAATYTVVTNSFLAGGGDGAATFAVAAGEGRIVDTFINYAQGLFDYIQQDLGGGPIVVPPPTEFSTQSFIPL